MASRRDLKKSINNLTFELISECFSYQYFHPKKKRDKTNIALESLVKTRNDLIHRVNHPIDKEDYKKNRVYFKEVIKDMNDMVSLMDNID